MWTIVCLSTLIAPVPEAGSTKRRSGQACIFKQLGSDGVKDDIGERDWRNDAMLSNSFPGHHFDPKTTTASLSKSRLPVRHTFRYM